MKSLRFYTHRFENVFYVIKFFFPGLIELYFFLNLQLVRWGECHRMVFHFHNMLKLQSGSNCVWGQTLNFIIVSNIFNTEFSIVEHSILRCLHWTSLSLYQMRYAEINLSTIFGCVKWRYRILNRASLVIMNRSQFHAIRVKPYIFS